MEFILRFAVLCAVTLALFRTAPENRKESVQMAVWLGLTAVIFLL